MTIKESILVLAAVLLFFSCGNSNSKGKEVTTKVPTRMVTPEKPVLHVYNMGGVPSNLVYQLTSRLKEIYPNTEYSGDLAFVESAYIKNDKKGNDRYWWSKLCPYIIKATDTKGGISLVFINAEVCNWTKDGSHANLGISNLGGHISFVSYQRLKKNRRDNVNDMLKIAVHELGHSVAKLVIGRKDLRFHCPNASCLMRDANNGFPYRGVTSFCPSCTKAMKTKGFNLDALQLEK